MSYPIQPYIPNNGPLVNQQFDRAMYGGNTGPGVDDILGSLFGLANQIMTEVLRNGPGAGGISSFMGSDPNNPHLNVFGISSMNVTQISRGPDGRPHIVQAHDERRMGPGGIVQTRKALRDPDRGIDKMQVGYFHGDRSEVYEHEFEPSSGPNPRQIQHHGIPPNQPNLPHQWRQQSMQRPAALQQQYPYYPQQHPSYPHQPQQHPSYPQQPQQALPAPRSYQY